MRLPFGHHASAAATRELDASSRQEREEAAAHAKTPKRTNRALASAPAAAPALDSRGGMRRCQSATMARRRAAPPVRKSRSHSQEPSGRYKPCRNPRLQAAPNATPVAIPPSARARLSFEADGQDLARMYDHATWNMYERIVTARRHRLSQMDSQGSEPDTSASSSPVEAEGPSTSQARPRSRAATTAKPTKLNSSDGSSTLSTADESDRTSITSSWSRPESPGAFPSAAVLGAATARAASCPPLPVAEGEEDDPLVFELDM